MGRCFAVALLSIGALSLSCNQVPNAARQAGFGNAAVSADSADPADYPPLGGLEARFAALAKNLAPSVVAISASSQSFDSEEVLSAERMNPEKLEALLDKTTRMVGTGLVVDADGYIVTNEHVVGEAENVWVTTDSGKVYPALVVGTDPRQDLAVLKIPKSGLTPVQFAPNPNIQRGQWAIALGNPYGLAAAGGQCISIGVVSAIDRSLPKLSKKENRLYSGLIQTTTTINPGNSGGPLFNLEGQVIGINTAVIMPEKKANGIGFAMPISAHLLSSIETLKQGREVVYAYLGVTVATPTAKERRSAGVSEDQGVRVDGVDKGSPADKLLEENDIILSINGQGVRESEQFVRIVGIASPDRKTRLIVRRDGDEKTLDVSLARRPTALSAVTRDSRRLRWEGMLLGAVPANWSHPTAKQGLVVLAISEKSRYAKNVKEGDVITAVAGRQVADVTDLQQILNDAGESRELKVSSRSAVMASGRE
jgi:serine protease Do